MSCVTVISGLILFFVVLKIKTLSKTDLIMIETLSEYRYIKLKKVLIFLVNGDKLKSPHIL